MSPGSSPSLRRNSTGFLAGGSSASARAISRIAAELDASSLAPGPAGTES
jgi:hypothetical protein